MEGVVSGGKGLQDEGGGRMEGVVSRRGAAGWSG